MIKGGIFVFLAAIVLVNGLPQVYRRKLSRQEVDAVAGTFVQSSLTPETGSLAPVGDVIENKVASSSTVMTIYDGEVPSTPIPSADGKAPAPVVVIPGVNVTGLSLEPQPVPQAVTQAPPFPARVNASTVAPTTTTAKPEEEDSSSEEEEEEELGGPGVTFGDVDNEESVEDDDDAEEEDEARKEVVIPAVVAKAPVVVAKAPVVVPAPAVAPVAVADPVVPKKEVAASVSQRVNSKARDEPFIEISTDIHALQDGPPRGHKYDAFIPGYMTDHGEIFVPIDTTDLRGPYSIVDDPGMRRNYPLEITAAEKQSRRQIPQKVLYDDDDDDTETSSQEDDDEDDEAQPVRLSSYNIIYPKKNKKDKEPEKDEDDDDDESEEKAVEVEETETPDSKEPEPVQPQGPTAQVVTDSSGDKVVKPVNSGLYINAGQGVKTQGGEGARPPSLAYVPARLPTGEDDENEFNARILEVDSPLFSADELDESEEDDYVPYFVSPQRSFRSHVPSISPYNYMLQ